MKFLKLTLCLCAFVPLCLSLTAGPIEIPADAGTRLAAVEARAASNAVSAQIIKYTGATATTMGKLYQWSTSVWVAAVCTNENACNRMLAVARGTNSTSAGMMILGEMTVTNNTLSPGAGIYVSNAGGEWTQAIPTNSGYIVRRIGYATETNKIEVMPDGTWLELE